MKILTLIFYQFLIFIILFVIIDNLIYELKANSDGQNKKIFFRHSAFLDNESEPSQFYAQISNETLDINPQRYRTGKYGEALSNEYDSNLYNHSCKIVILGGSSTETRWVNEKSRWPALIESELRKLGKDVAVFNFGTGGQNLNHSIIKYFSYIAEIKPDVVLMAHEANDIGKLLKGSYYVREADLYNSYFIENDKMSIQKRVKSLITSTLPYSYNFFRDYRNKRYAKKILTEEIIPFRSSNEEFIGLSPIEASKSFFARVAALNAFIANDKGNFFIIEYPEVYDAVINDKDDFNKRPRKEIARMSALNGLSKEEFYKYWLDFRTSLKKMINDSNIKMILKDENLDTKDFYDAIHFNEKGSKKYAKYLSNEILNYDICE